MTNHHHHTQCQAIEIAVDAHASRLLRQHSPPEACVDFSSLGPYVTECLRKSIAPSSSGGSGLLNGSKNGGGIGNSVEASSRNANAKNDLIELLEGQCEMTRDTARMVIANIDRAVRTGDILVAGDDNKTFNNNSSLRGYIIGGGGGGHGGMNMNMSSGGGDTRRTRSKSLGSEPLAYDVSFLGKILQDTMMMPSAHSSSTPVGADLSAAFASAAPNEHNPIITSPSSGENATSAIEDVSMGILRPPNGFDIIPSSTTRSAAFAVNNPNKARNKQRSVTFDETQSSTSFLWYNNTAVGPAVVKEDDDVHFNPLGGILDALDFEEEGGHQQQEQQQEAHNIMMESILETSFATVDSNKSDGHNEKESKTAMTASSSVAIDVQGGVNDGSLLLPQCQMIFDLNEKVKASSPSSSSSPSSADFPTLGEACGDDTKSLSRKQNGSSGKGRKSKKKKEANDLAAALFRPSRSRSNSLMDHSNQRPRALSLASSSMLRPLSADAGVFSAPSSGNGVGMGSLLSQSLEAVAAGNANIATNSSESNTASSSPSPLINNNINMQSEVNSTTELLLTLNSHLGTEAATLASQLTDGDLNLAQYLIEAARFDTSSEARSCNIANNSNRRSRICRHELRGTCYRSDCPYSHDLGGVTCLFWLRGRCRGESCRFMHGFAESLLDGISEGYLNEKREQDVRKEREKEEEGRKIQTGNLLQHNQWSAASAGSNNLSTSLPNHGFMFLSPSQGGNDASVATVWR